jgi:hypothetical protein
VRTPGDATGLAPRDPVAAIPEVFRQSERFLVSSHSCPDGDAVQAGVEVAIGFAGGGRAHGVHSFCAPQGGTPTPVSARKFLVFSGIQWGRRSKYLILLEFFTAIRQQRSYGRFSLNSRV